VVKKEERASTIQTAGFAASPDLDLLLPRSGATEWSTLLFFYLRPFASICG
jgi:hypothetical protein